MPAQRQYWLARLHPASGETASVLRYGDWSFDRRDLIGLFYALHTNLTLGALGKGLQILVAAGGLLLVAAGFVVWRGRRTVPPTAIDRPVRRWHRRIGIVAALALALLLTSGLTLQFETVLDPGFGYRSQRLEGRPPIGVRAAWQAAAQPFGDVDTRLIMGPFIDGGVYRVDLIPRNGELAGQTIEVFVDAWSAAVIRVRHDGDREGIARLLGWLEALHGGRVLGLPGEVLAAIAGLAPALLFATGLRIRWQRRR